MGERIKLGGGRVRLTGRKLALGAGDELAKLPARDVAAWYGRLADACEKNGMQLSAQLLRRWLLNRKPGMHVHLPAHEHLVRSQAVKEALAYHRRVFLTEEKARQTGRSPIWAGVLPRLEGSHDHAHWDGSGAIDMHYESLAGDESGFSVSLKARFGKMAIEDLDVFAALHGFQLRSDVWVHGAPLGKRRMRITFTEWKASVSDTYHWDPDKRLTVPNPDYGSARPGAVRPDLDEITVYHGNAKRLEDQGMAGWFSYDTDEWNVSDPSISSPGDVDLDKDLD